MARRKHSALTASRLRSCITNGSHLFLADVDGRSAWMRRIKDLLRSYEETDCGGSASLSEGQRAIIRRAVFLQVACEQQERRIAENGGIASREDLETYQRSSNSLRRLIESLQLHQGRKPRDVTSHDAEVMRLYEKELRAP
jgi:hypothetical protein